MPRPKLHSDEAILDAASAVLLERGLADYTLSDVAERVGLSRAAIIQRFENKDGLLLRIAQREVQLTREYLDSLPHEEGPAGLESFLRTIVESMGSGADFSPRVQLAWAESRDPELRRLAGQRYQLVQDAIVARLPEMPMPNAIVARHLHAVIAGATMQWLASDHPDLSAYVMESLATALHILKSKLDISPPNL